MGRETVGEARGCTWRAEGAGKRSQEGWVGGFRVLVIQ